MSAVRIECRTQIEAQKVLDDGNHPILLEGSFNLTIGGALAPVIVVMAKAALFLLARGSSQPHVEAWGSSRPHVVARESSQPHVEAWGSSRPHVVARESSQPHVVARESSQPHVVARESSQPHVEARESSQPHVEAWESSQPHVEAWGYVQLSLAGAVIAKAVATVAVLIRGTKAKVRGGKQTRIKLKTAADWCGFYGVPIKRGIAVLFKAVRDDFKTSQHGFLYQPGTTPSAPDWDGGKQECGGGLHFSPSPNAAREFDGGATKYIACPVKVSEIAIHPDGQYPQKCKAPRVCAPCWEVDRSGKRVAEKAAK